MSSESIQDTVNEIRETRTQLENIEVNNALHIHKLELKVQALTAELDSLNTYYSGINDLLDRLSTVKGAVQKQRIAIQIMDLRDRKRGLKRVEQSPE